jgi:hypothetical protein
VSWFDAVSVNWDSAELKWGTHTHRGEYLCPWPPSWELQTSSVLQTARGAYARRDGGQGQKGEESGSARGGRRREKRRSRRGQQKRGAENERQNDDIGQSGKAAALWPSRERFVAATSPQRLFSACKYLFVQSAGFSLENICAPGLSLKNTQNGSI